MPLPPGRGEELSRQFDWRHRAATVTTDDIPDRGPGKPFHPAGSPVVLVSAANRGAPDYRFPLPSASGILVDAAHRAYEEWKRVNPLLQKEKVEHRAAFGDVPWFDTARAGFTAVLAGYTAIEGEVNDLVPRGKSYHKTTRNGKTDRMSHERVVQELSLQEKLVSVMPQLAGVSDPTQQPYWNDFAVLRELRHRIVHLSPADVQNWQGDLIPDTIWGRIFDPSLPNPARVAKALLQHVGADRAPRWTRYAPF